MAIVASYLTSSLLACRVGKEILRRASLTRILIAMSIHDITTKTQVISLTNIEVNTDTLCGGDTILTAKSAKSATTLVGEGHVIGIIRTA